MTQPDLFENTKAEDRLCEIGRHLEVVLETQRDWITVEQLRAQYNQVAWIDTLARPVSRTTIRHAIATTCGAITSGQSGVRLTRFTTRDEHAGAVATMGAQIKGLCKRRSEMIRAFHRGSE
tara:strand:+ start:830 stop:1192 length:363 start_codon:yes stop_codon:yes gene_type:complete